MSQISLFLFRRFLFRRFLFRWFIATRNRREALLNTLERLSALPERPPVIRHL
jgi:hypothetical protein